MSVMAENLMAHLLGLDPVVRAGELVVIETEVQKIINVIKQQTGEVTPHRFRNNAFIPAGDFGSGAKASNLASHHTRAHAVMADTLVGVQADLEEFMSACKDAKKFLGEADLTAQGDLKAVTNAVYALQHGSASNHGDTAYRNAQVNHRNDGTTDGGDA